MTVVSSSAGSRARRGRSAPADLFDRDEIDAKLERRRAKTQERRRRVPPRRGRRCSPPRSKPGAPRRSAALEDGGGGRACARALSDLEDEMIRAVHDMAVRLAHAEGAAKAKGLTILAVGGYGRGMLAPGSDIDLLFLLDDEKDAASAKLIETILYVLWDLKQKVGHATRTIDECLRQARADMTIRTSLLEARLILGDDEDARDAERALRQGDRRQDGERIRRRQARRARRARQPRRRVALSGRAQRQGGQGRPARPQHAVLDRQIRLSGARPARAGRSGPVLAARIQPVLALRGIPVEGALPPPFPHRPRRGAAELRRAAADRRAPRLRGARRPGRRRAVHEALFPRRQGRRRPDRDRLRRARGAAGQADAGVRPLPRPAAAAAAGARRRAGFQDRPRPHQRHPRRRVRARSGQPHPSLLGGRPLEPGDPSRRDAARHPIAEAHRRRRARRSGGQPAVPRNPHLAPIAGGGAAADERSGRARPLHPRFRPRRRADAVLDVSPLHDRRASAAHRRRAEPDRVGRAEGGAPAGQRTAAPHAQPHGALCRGVPARHRQGPARRPFDRRSGSRAPPLPAPRPVAGRYATASPG